MIVNGFLNVSRARHSDGLTRAFSLIANLLILVLAMGLAWPLRYHVLHNWQMRDIPNVLSMGTFLMWFDKVVPSNLQALRCCPKLFKRLFAAL
jgi:hypothetical protein